MSENQKLRKELDTTEKISKRLEQSPLRKLQENLKKEKQENKEDELN